MSCAYHGQGEGLVGQARAALGLELVLDAAVAVAGLSAHAGDLVRGACVGASRASPLAAMILDMGWSYICDRYCARVIQDRTERIEIVHIDAISRRE